MTTVYKHVNLLDGTKDMKLQKDVDILVEDELIKGIGRFDEADKIVDLKGKYVIPGLINLHVHLPGSGLVKKKPVDNKKLVNLIKKVKPLRFLGTALTKKYAVIELKSGVTTLRSVGGVGSFDTEVRDAIKQGKYEGPRIYASNEALTIPGGHMEGTVARGYTTLQEFKDGVKDLKSQGVDWIKIMITGGVLDCTGKGSPGEMKMTPEQVKTVTDLAHKYGFKVAAHIESPEGMKVAIQNGVDSCEHGAPMTADTLKLFKKNDGVLVATLSPAVPLSFVPEEESYFSSIGRYNSYVILKNIIVAGKQCLKEGIRVGLGTDTGCPFTTHYAFYRELMWAEKMLGVSPATALYMGTLNNAYILGEEKKLGSIEVGKFADMVVLDKDPLKDFTTISTPYMVIKGGKKVKNIKIKKDKYVEEHLDKLMNLNFEKEIDKYLKENL